MPANDFFADEECRADGGPVIGLSGAALARLMPLHLCVDAQARVAHMGDTLRRILDLPPKAFPLLFDVLEVLRPHAASTLSDLLHMQAATLKLRLRAGPKIVMRAMVVPLPAGGGALLNLSFGASIVDAIECCNLTLRDFAPTELTGELLFLIEAKSAAFRQSQELNARLDQARSMAEVQAQTDPLTGLRNRRAMDASLAAMTALNGGPSFGLMHVDLDYFKVVNDTFGHAAGDHVLREVARILREETRQNDVIARIGGDEFVVLLEKCADPKVLDRVATRIIARLEQPIEFEGQSCLISASIGTTLSMFYRAPSAEKMLSDVDEATYASKRGGRARHTVYSPSTSDARSEPDIEHATGVAGDT